jgi:hypothetical protein
MNGTLNELTLKKEEAALFLLMIQDVTAKPGGVAKASLLKSSLVVMLYNAIESTMTLVFERVHEEIGKIAYPDLSPKIKAIWVDYFFIQNNSKHYQLHLEGAISKTLKLPDLDVFLNRIKLFSGNLDGRQLDELMKRYGIGTLKTRNRNLLLIVKNKRNAIAHGEQSFKEACREMTINDIEKLIKATFVALDDIIQQVNDYFSQRKYIA